MEPMSKTERIDAALAGEEVDRVPMSFWRHFYHQEHDAALLADALVSFQREFGWDFMKVNPRAQYHVEDWGNRYRYTENPFARPELVSHVVHDRADWARISPLNIWTATALKQQLVLLELVKEGLQGEDVYYLQTVFSPLDIAYRLAGHSRERLIQAMESEAQELDGALDAIAQTFVKYVEACLDAGASGIFFTPTKLASADFMAEEQYRRFGEPCDLRVLDAVQGRKGFNLLHLCGTNVFFDSLSGYPVDALSWDVHAAGNPGLSEGWDRTGRMVVGGIDQGKLAGSTPEEVAEMVRTAMEETGGRGCVIAPGCTFRPNTPKELLRAAREAASQVGEIS